MRTPTPVFIDTCTFEGLDFEWGGKQLSLLLEHIKAGRCRLYLTQVSVEEVKRRLKVSCHRATELQNQAANALKKTGKPQPASIDVDVQGALDRFLDFLKKSRAVIHPPDKVSCGYLVELWKKQEAPFSAKKPDEFKDALTLLSLRTLPAKERSKLVIVSDDNDLSLQGGAGSGFRRARLSEVLRDLEIVRSAEPDQIKALERLLKLQTAQLLEQVESDVVTRDVEIQEPGAIGDEIRVADSTVGSIEVVEFHGVQQEAIVVLQGYMRLEVVAEVCVEGTAQLSERTRELVYGEKFQGILVHELAYRALIWLRFHKNFDGFRVKRVSVNVPNPVVFQLDQNSEGGTV